MFYPSAKRGSQRLLLRQFRVRRAACLAGVILGLSAQLAAAQLGIPHDAGLIDKLYRHDFGQISDDNNGRVDISAVMMAFSFGKTCPNKDGRGLDLAAIAEYGRYLTADSKTGESPSHEFLRISLLNVFGDNARDAWAFHPGTLAMAAEIDISGCQSPRVRKIRENLRQLLDERIAWHQQKLELQAPLRNQSLVSVKDHDWQAGLAKVGRSQQEAVRRQIGDLEMRGAQLSRCTYGPTSPDNTGSETVVFWYKDVPLSMAALMMVSREHPFAGLGDVAVNTCPRTLADAYTQVQQSVQVGQSRVDPSSLPPAQVSLERFMGSDYNTYTLIKSDWAAYQATNNNASLTRAIGNKANLLARYERSCQLASADKSNPFCRVRQQIADDFADIPDRAAANPPRQSRGDGRVAPNGPSLPVEPPADARSLPAGLLISVTTIDAIDIGGAESGGSFRARLDQPLMEQGRVVVPQGAEIHLKARNKQWTGDAAHIAVTVDYVTIENERVPISASELLKTLWRNPPSQRPNTSRVAVIAPGTRLVFRTGQ
jgi:hypothetical protein